MTKSRTLRKAAAVALSLAMAFSVATVSTDASAAAKPSLKKTKVTVKAKKSVKVGIKNYKLVTKLTVKSKNTKIAKVAKVSKTKGVKITGVKEGKTKVVVTIKYKSGKKTKTLKKNITVTVAKAATDDDGTVVTESLKLVDKDGLQTDGTAALGDNLQVEIPASIGTIDRINWYVDDKLIKTSGTLGDGSESGATTLAGSYVARVITTKGTTYSSNAIKVTATEVRATLTNLTFEDDYSDNFLTFAKANARSFVSVTMNKDYAGTLKLYKSKDGKISDKATAGTALTTKATASKYDNSEAWSLHEIYAKDVNGATVGHKASVTHNADGTVTYKWIYNGTVDRGQTYVALFDQAKVIDDDVNAKEPNITTEVAAPYVVAPKSVTLGPIAEGLPVPVNFVGEDGKAITWLGSSTNGDKFADCGIKEITVYADTSNAVSNKSTTKEAIAATQLIKAGVVKTNANANTAGTFTGKSWYVAEAKLAKDVYGKEDIPLTSVATNTNAKVADGAEVKPAADPKNAEIAFTNLSADATVYLIQGTDKKAAAARVADFDASKADTYNKSVEVTKGAKSATIEGAFSKVYTTEAGAANLNTYTIVVVPKDETNFGRIVGTTKSPLKQVVTKYALASGYGYKGISTAGGATTNLTITGQAFTVGAAPAESDNASDFIIVNDQYGNRMSSDAILADADHPFGAGRALTFTADSAAPGITPTLTIVATSGSKIIATIDNNIPTKGGVIVTAKDSWTGQTFTLKSRVLNNTTAVAAGMTGFAEALANNGDVVWDLTLS